MKITALRPSGYHDKSLNKVALQNNLGFRRGVKIGSAKDRAVKALISRLGANPRIQSVGEGVAANAGQCLPGCNERHENQEILQEVNAESDDRRSKVKLGFSLYRIMDARFPETSPWESHVPLLSPWLRRKPLRLRRQTEGRFLGYLKSR